ncbi:hypothetical protein [Afifella pfennigii]|uniref:hypothetical protein n=1 Tax=Afifella pfennigii TaxID=209897 RepID=UPI00047AFDB6|nr:hypothetical protein [Afifella pfennigii]
MRTRLLALALALSAAFAVSAGPAMAQDKPSLVTVLTSAEPQTQLMAMILTMQAAQQGSETHILLCGPAGDIALKSPPSTALELQKPRGMSPQGLMKTIMDKTGTKVEVCALYLPNKGVGPEALIEGVSAAEPGPMAGELLADNTRILSF